MYSPQLSGNGGEGVVVRATKPRAEDATMPRRCTRALSSALNQVFLTTKLVSKASDNSKSTYCMDNFECAHSVLQQSHFHSVLVLEYCFICGPEEEPLHARSFRAETPLDPAGQITCGAADCSIVPRRSRSAMVQRKRSLPCECECVRGRKCV